MSFSIPSSDEFRSRAARLESFAAEWRAGHLPAESVEAWRAAAAVQSVGSSCRLAGLRVSNDQVASTLRGECQAPESVEVLGYARSLSEPLVKGDELLTLDALQRLNARALGASDGAPPSPLRESPLHHEAFDQEGRALGLVFQTLPPRVVREKSEDLLAWLELELRTRENPATIVIAVFGLALLAVSPFERGSGRTARLATGHLLKRAGLCHLPFASLEREIEEARTRYYEALDASQTRLWSGEADLSPWISFFLGALEEQRLRVERLLQPEMAELDLPPLQRLILETVREHGSAAAALLLQTTGANRNTLKDNLRRMVERRLLERFGEKRGSYYRLPGVEGRPDA